MAYDSTKPYKIVIKDCIKQTWNTKNCIVDNNGVYPIYKKIKNAKNSKGWETSHTDGIGTKGIFHWLNRSFHDAVSDALFMNLNDLIMIKAHPYSLQNHLILPEDDHRAIEDIIFNLASLCKKYEIAITGGETSIHNNIEGMDISITVNGYIEDEDVYFCNKIREGDVVLGYNSNGLHSNGFTKIRELLPQNYLSENPSALKVLTTPTKCYYDKYNLYGPYVHGMMHMTGGAFAKLKDILPYNLDVFITGMNKIEDNNKALFKKLYDRVKDDEVMYKTFNCGIGFIFTTAERNLDLLINDGFTILGHVSKGNGNVNINSQFSNNVVKL